jgi:RimJ/RimL family protein N-acetyltransferase
MIEYRMLKHEDYNDIVDISKDIWDGTDYLPQVFLKWVEDKGFFLGALDTTLNKIIGVGKFSILYDMSGWLEGLRVHKDYRDQKIAREIIERLFSIAKEQLKEGNIIKIAFSTHVSSIRSISLMKKLDFKLEQEYILVSKKYDKFEKNISMDDFNVKEWDLSFDEFMTLPYLKRRKNILPLTFIFQAPTLELYSELKNEKCFISINGFNGIFKFKGEPHFICIDDTFEGINTFMNYYLLKFQDKNMPQLITSVIPDDDRLIWELKKDDFESWNDWRPDYLYYIYK